MTETDWPFGDDENDIDMAATADDEPEHEKRVITVAPPWWAVFGAIDDERHRQIEKWGEQHHADGTEHWQRSKADHARYACEKAFRNGRGTWRHILTKEFFEAMCETEPLKLASELVQVAAVCVAWLEDIASRQAA